MPLPFAVIFLYALQVYAGDLSKFSPFDHLRNEYKLSNGRSVMVFDGALPEQHLMGLSIFMSATDHWRYVLHDPHLSGSGRLYDDRNGMPWKSWTDPAPIRGTVVGSKLKNLVQAVDARFQNEDANFEINEIYSALVRRGDRTKIHLETGADENSYTVAIFNNIVWRKNGYGELLFYDDGGEILASIRPKFGRIVVWHSSIPYILRPPSIAQLTTESITIVQFGANTTKNSQKLAYYHNFMQELKQPPFLTSWLENIPRKTVTDEDVKNHLTLMRRNRKNHFVAVFDGLFDEASLSALRSWTIKYGLYFFDGSVDANSDNVHWIAGINVDNFVKTNFWPIIHKIAKFVSNTSGWYPYDVACNLIRSYDHTRFHLDTSHPKEKEMTFLLYLSPNWTAADYGETAFMETNDDNPTNEYVAEVVPMYGRAVIFDGNFPHSAHPPSVMHYNARYTFAVKLSFTKMHAVKKTFSEESRHEPNFAHAVSEVAKLSFAPEAAVANQKVTSVAEHLSSRNIINQISSSAMEAEDGEEEHEPEGQEGDENDSDDENMDDVGEYERKIPPSHNDEEETPQEEGEMDGEELDQYLSVLTKNQQLMIQYMIRHHRLEEKLSALNEEDQVKAVDYSFIDPEKRQATIKKWQQMASKDPDMLNDFLELYLKQVKWLKDYTAKKMIALL